MVSLVITICIITLSVMPLLSTTSLSPHHRTSMEPPRSQFPPRNLEPFDGSVPMARDGSLMSKEEEERRKYIVDSTEGRYASRDKKGTTGRMLMTTATIHREARKEDKREGTRREEWSSSNNRKHGRYYNKYYFTMDYSGVRRRRPIHNKFMPSSSSSITP